MIPRNIACSGCGRAFQLDDALVGNVAAARCLCGERLPLRPEAPGTGGGTRRLGKYVIERRIAVGGMGEIFYGKIPGVEGFEREVAIKKMLPHLSNDRAFIDMMVKEAKLTVLLNHPNIVQVYDLAKEGEEYYIAMEYVPGATIGAMLEKCHREKKRLPGEVVVHIAVNVLRGLGYAHGMRGADGAPMNILHRDITPQNILVTRDAWVKITDFGIAKARNEISTTSPGMIKGKLGYIAPEQLGGHDADHRVDLFCVGILLWESFATRRLFKGTDEVDTFRLIAETKVPSLRALREDVTPQLEAVVFKALARDPDARYLNAQDFTEDLLAAISPRTADDYATAARSYFREHGEFFTDVEAISNDDQLGIEPTVPVSGMSSSSQPVEANLLSVTDLAWHPPRRARWWPSALAAGAAALLAAAGVIWWQRSQVAAPSVTTPISQVATKDSNGTEVIEDAVVKRPAQKRVPQGRPKPLTAAEIQLGVQKQRESIARCLSMLDTKTAPAEVVAQISIDPEGVVSDVELQPRLPDEKVQRCLVRSLTAMRFRRHGKTFRANIPLRIQVM